MLRSPDLFLVIKIIRQGKTSAKKADMDVLMKFSSLRPSILFIRTYKKKVREPDLMYKGITKHRSIQK